MLVLGIPSLHSRLPAPGQSIYFVISFEKSVVTLRRVVQFHVRAGKLKLESVDCRWKDGEVDGDRYQLGRA